ncbi:LacI family DNA-binding transcriptional regulator [Microbacterium sp. APC 3901]|uniref:LacI family DNA-binding transcriptional regulator n=1 Tax=Microbacterium sp. APC 3901 TaxID=3035192 RepID=UPI0025B33F26|nr:LacI family DNA-binding transcriptional regulator [Microbacterium sp. APC 3901]MDN3445499.1 LacI family DNA-binding transcriptional regulator [Microbacterium sp. APC 3901]
MSPARRVTISDIARLAGVSPGAVSFALNGRPGVSAETRARILEVAAQHDWLPSSTARALAGARSGVIGFAVNRPARTLGAEAFFIDLTAGVQSALAPHHLALQTALVPSIDEEIATYRRWRSSHQVDGVVVIDPRDDDPRMPALRDLALPAVVIGSLRSEPDHPATLQVDDERVAHTLFEHLVGLGHRRIAYVSGPAEFQHTRLRAEALWELAVEGVAGTVIPTDSSPAAASAALARLLADEVSPSAVVFDSDVMAIAGLRAAQERRLAVPADLSIASFDDSTVAALVRPSITAMTRDTFGLGAAAANFLIDQIAASAPLPDRSGSAPVLSVRESTARAH